MVTILPRGLEGGSQVRGEGSLPSQNLPSALLCGTVTGHQVPALPGGRDLVHHQGRPPMITITKAVRTSFACPSQWDAWDKDGTYYYLRYRSAHGSVTTYPRQDWDGSDIPETIAEFTKDTDPLDGCIGLREFAGRAGILLAEDGDLEGL